MRRTFVLSVFLSLFLCNADAKEYVLGKTAFYVGNSDGEQEVLFKDVENNSITGQIIEYFDNGKTKNIFEVKNGVLDGVQKTYNEDGVLTSEQNMKNGELDGFSKKYYENNGYLEGYMTFKNGNVISIKRYDKKAVLQEEADLSKGVYRSYYSNGMLKTSENLTKDGKPDGIQRSYYRDGGLQQEATFSNGELYGGEKVYYPTGELAQEIIAGNRGYSGVVKTYYKDGKLKQDATIKDGKLEGVAKFYDEDGNLKETIVFRKGKVDGKTKSELLFSNWGDLDRFIY